MVITFPCGETFYPDSIYRGLMVKLEQRSLHLGEQPLQARRAHPTPPGSQPRPHPVQRPLPAQVRRLSGVLIQKLPEGVTLASGGH